MPLRISSLVSGSVRIRKRRIVADHLAQGLGQLGFVDVLGRDQCLGDHRLGEADFLQDDRLTLSAKRVARRGVLEADDGDDFARAGDFEAIAAVAHQAVNVADAFGPFDAGVQ